MALISVSDWIDRHGDELDDADASDLPLLTFRAVPETAAPRPDYRISAVLPIGSEIADTRTRLL